MNFAFVFVLGFALFLGRDAALLSGGRRLWPVFCYSLIVSTVCSLLGAAAEWISRDDAVGLLRDVRLWLPAVAAHCILWMAFWLIRRGTASRWSWLLALIPAPVFVYSSAGLCWLLLQGAEGWAGWQVGAALGLGASGVVFLTSRLLYGAGTSISGSLEFAAASNLAAILLLPLYEGSAPAGPAWEFTDWPATFWALGATAVLISLSFAFHRLRQRP